MCSKTKALRILASISLVVLLYSLTSNHVIDNPGITPPLVSNHLIQSDYKKTITPPTISLPEEDSKFCIKPNMHIDDKMCIKPHICADEKMAIKPDALHRK